MRFVCALLVFGFSLTAAAECPNVQLELKLKKAGSGLEVEAALKNTGQAPIELMATGDGSSFGRRNPKLTFTLEPNHVAKVGTCGFMNALTDEDFVTLKPGERRKLDWVHPPTPDQAGKYTLTVTYTNDPAAELLGSGSPKPPTPAQLARFAKTAQCTVQSAPLHFTWDGKRASK